MGYYTAILAELVGPEGRGAGRRDRRAAGEGGARGARALASGESGERRRIGRRLRELRRHRRERRGDASAAVVAPGLNLGGRLLFPMTFAGRGGGMLLARRSSGAGRPPGLASAAWRLPGIRHCGTCPAPPGNRRGYSARLDGRFASTWTARPAPPGRAR